jgi:hypothetical protein
MRFTLLFPPLLTLFCLFSTNTPMTNTPLSHLSLDLLRRAVGIREQMDALERELAGIIGSPAAPSVRRGGRRTMSPAARAKIAAAQRRRWAKQRRISAYSAAPARRGRRRMSAAARARISAAAKARWARAKAAGRNSL